jgi:hypothetical protein
MRQYNLIILFFLFPLFAIGQAPFPNRDEINQFKLSKTCVVLEDDQFSAFNTFTRKAMGAFWKITPFEFIDATGFEERRKQPGFSFITLSQTNFEKDKSNTSFNFLNLLQGKNIEKLGQMPEICAVPLSSAGEDDLDYGYKLGAILLFMQKHAQMISDDPSLTGRRYLRYYNKNIPLVAGKTILLKVEDLSPGISSIEKINALCSLNIKIVTEDEIVTAIQNKTPKTLILHKVGPGTDKTSGYCFKMLIGTDDSVMYYYNQHTIDEENPDGLLPADLKRLVR